MNHDAIAKRIPHAGRMCLLDTMQSWDDTHIICTATSHRAKENPLRSASGLLAPAAIEYAAQAMALHGGLIAEKRDPTASPTPGFLASVRAVQLHVARLDDLPSPLIVHATRNAAQGLSILYDFTVRAAEQLVVEGRATVVLNTPVIAAPGAIP